MSNTHGRLHAGAPVTEPEITAAEARLGQPYPPSFRALLVEHGRFRIVGPSSESVTFEVWPLDEHVTALQRAADELECEATASDVADQLGLEEETLATLAQIVLVGSEGNTDFVGYDLRTRDGTTGEASFVLHLMDDLEIEYLAEHPGGSGDAAPGFASFVAKHATRH